MLDNSGSSGRSPHASGNAATDYSASLVELYKAFKAMTFYPEGHPLRDQILHRSHQALVHAVAGGELSLLVGRAGLSVAGEEDRIENNRLIQALARELFARELQRLTISPDVSFVDFTTFLSVLSLEPQRIIGEGGLARLLTEHGVSTIVANGIDIAAVFTRRTMADASEGPVDAVGSAGEASAALSATGGQASARAGAAGSDEGAAAAPSTPPDNLDDLTVAELLAVMVNEADDSRYGRLAFLLTGKGQALKLEGGFDELFPVLLGLLNHNADETRSEFQRHAALSAFRELVAGTMTDHLLDHLQDEAFTRQEIVYLLLHHLGGAAVTDLVERLVATESEPVRKNLTTAVLRIGAPAVAPLLNLLQSSVWQVVRVTAAVLGQVGGREAARGLALAAYHRDNRVRSEAIRSLAAIGGREATETLLGLLQDSNPAIRRLAILWLGISRNDKAIQPLLDLVTARDLLCKSAVLKKEALRALGRIGDRRVLPTLYRVVRKRHLLAAGRWHAVQVLAVESIGRLGGQEARAFLSHMVDRRGLIGTTCRTVLESMEQEKETSNG